MEIIISNKLVLQDVPFGFLEVLKERLSFINPKWEENEKRGYWNGETPRVLKFYEVSDNGALIIPRGFIRHLLSLCKRHGVQYGIEDSRRTLPQVDFQFQGTLRPFQEQAVREVLSKEFGVLSSPTGSGKTVMCLSVIAERRQPALIICHTRELQNQWIDRIETFLGIPANEVGIIGNGKKFLGNRLTVSLVQSLYKRAHEVAPHIGFLIVDECHRIPSRTFTEAVTAFDAKYMLGLSATPFRRDGLSRLIFWHLGDQVHKVERDDLVRKGHVLPFEVITRETNFQTSYDPSEEYSKMLSELVEDYERNAMIVQDIIKESNAGGGICLILSDRKKHCETISQLLYAYGVRSEVLNGGVSNKDRQEIVARLDEGLAKIVIATGQLIGEGFDCPGLSTLFMVTPIRFSGRLLQTVGRILRPAPGKKARIFDYIDSKIGVLQASAKARQRIYKSNF